MNTAEDTQVQQTVHPSKFAGLRTKDEATQFWISGSSAAASCAVLALIAGESPLWLPAHSLIGFALNSLLFWHGSYKWADVVALTVFLRCGAAIIEHYHTVKPSGSGMSLLMACLTVLVGASMLQLREARLSLTLLQTLAFSLGQHFLVNERELGRPSYIANLAMLAINILACCHTGGLVRGKILGVNIPALSFAMHASNFFSILTPHSFGSKLNYGAAVGLLYTFLTHLLDRATPIRHTELIGHVAVSTVASLVLSSIPARILSFLPVTASQQALIFLSLIGLSSLPVAFRLAMWVRQRIIIAIVAVWVAAVLHTSKTSSMLSAAGCASAVSFLSATTLVNQLELRLGINALLAGLFSFIYMDDWTLPGLLLPIGLAVSLGESIAATHANRSINQQWSWLFIGISVALCISFVRAAASRMPIYALDASDIDEAVSLTMGLLLTSVLATPQAAEMRHIILTVTAVSVFVISRRLELNFWDWSLLSAFVAAAPVKRPAPGTQWIIGQYRILNTLCMLFGVLCVTELRDIMQTSQKEPLNALINFSTLSLTIPAFVVFISRLLNQHWQTTVDVWMLCGPIAAIPLLSGTTLIRYMATLAICLSIAGRIIDGQHTQRIAKKL